MLGLGVQEWSGELLELGLQLGCRGHWSPSLSFGFELGLGSLPLVACLPVSSFDLACPVYHLSVLGLWFAGFGLGWSSVR